MSASVPASMAIDQARELTALRHELALYRALIRQAEEACGDFLKGPHDDLIGAIQDLRQVAQSARELAEHLREENRLLHAALDLAVRYGIAIQAHDESHDEKPSDECEICKLVRKTSALLADLEGQGRSE